MHLGAAVGTYRTTALTQLEVKLLKFEQKERYKLWNRDTNHPEYRQAYIQHLLIERRKTETAIDTKLAQIHAIRRREAAVSGIEVSVKLKEERSLWRGVERKYSTWYGRVVSYPRLFDHFVFLLLTTVLCCALMMKNFGGFNFVNLQRFPFQLSRLIFAT